MLPNASASLHNVKVVYANKQFMHTGCPLWSYTTGDVF